MEKLFMVKRYFYVSMATVKTKFACEIDLNKKKGSKLTFFTILSITWPFLGGTVSFQLRSVYLLILLDLIIRLGMFNFYRGPTGGPK